MQVKTADLKRLLEVTSRKQFVNAKPQQQVIGCVIRPWGGSTSTGHTAKTTSLVRDGKTSLAQFSMDCDWEEHEDAIVVPDIERLLGVLSAHGGEATLTQDGGSLRIKSKGKQTTLVAEPGSLAFPHTQETIAQWEEKSMSLAEQIDATAPSYKMRDGSERTAFFCADTGSSLLHEALKADNINSQKLNQYQFIHDGSNTLSVRVGTDLKGETHTILNEECPYDEAFESVYEGGLEQVLAHYDGLVSLCFLDFRPEGQGIRLIARFDNDDWVFQAAVLKR